MILILLSWIYIFFTTLSFGLVFSKVMRIRHYDIVITPVLGLFIVTVFAACWAFFGPIAFAFHCVMAVLSVLFWYRNKAAFIIIFQTALQQLRQFSFPFKILLGFSSILILAQSATLPFIIDNESYYIQTIKWLNEYGYVKGLANLHLFFGQTSGWHIAQSAYSFSFLYDRLNDLNGFCLLLLNFFAFRKLQHYFTNAGTLNLVFGLIPLTYVFLFQFISSPSPDFGIYFLAFILFSIYLQHEVSHDRFTIITVLALFAVLVKITAIVLLLFPIMVLLIDFKSHRQQLASLGAIAATVFVIMITKNTLLTGYPLFPINCVMIAEFDYAVPSIIMDFFFSKSMLHSFYIDNTVFHDATVPQLLKQYFLHNGLSGYIGIASLFALVVTPFLLIRKEFPRTLWTVYLTFVLLTVLLLFSSPQYRFYVYFTLFFLILMLSILVTSARWITRLYTLSLTVTAVLILVPMSFGGLTNNALLSQNSTLHLKDIFIPEPNSKWSTEFKGASVGNMIYQTPVDGSFFWVTGNGKLPCVNQQQVEYFEQGFFYIPQQRSIKLQDGFYSQKISGHE